MTALRHAARTLARHPRLALPVVVLLGIAVGAAGAVFGLVHAVLLRPLPYPDPDRLVMVWSAAPGQPAPDTVAWPDFLDWRRESRGFAGLAAFNGRDGLLTGGGEPEQVPGAAVSPGFFEVLGVRPWAGRFFAAGDPARPEAGVVVLGHGLWRRRFGGSRAVLGRRIELSGETVEVIGIAPPTLHQPEPFAGPEAQFWVPLAVAPWMSNRGAHALRVLGRLRPGVGLRAAQAEMSALARRLHAAHPEADPEVRLVPLHRQLVGDLRPALLLLLAAMGALLLAACANAGNRLLVHRLQHERDLRMREALGAGAGLLAGQAMAEGLLLGLGGGALGLVLAGWGGTLLARGFPVAVQGIEPLRFGLPAALVTGGLGLGAGLLLGLPTAARLAFVWRGRRGGDLGPRGAPLAAPGGRRAALLRGALLICEVALALPLVAAAALLTQSLLRLRAVDPGFRAARVTCFSLSLPTARYPARPEQRAFFAALAEQLAALPGVRAAGVAATLPLSGVNDQELGVVVRGGTAAGMEEGTVGAAGTAGAVARQDLSTHYQLVSPGYFAALGIPIVAGRSFDGRFLVGQLQARSCGNRDQSTCKVPSSLP